MSLFTLRRMSYPKLVEFISKAEAIRCEKERQEKAKVRSELASFAREKGFSLEEIVGGKKAAHRASGKQRRIYTFAAPKYRNPSNPSQTWNGQGRPPNWYKALQGQRLTEALA